PQQSQGMIRTTDRSVSQRHGCNGVGVAPCCTRALLTFEQLNSLPKQAFCLRTSNLFGSVGGVVYSGQVRRSLLHGPSISVEGLFEQTECHRPFTPVKKSVSDRRQLRCLLVRTIRNFGQPPVLKQISKLDEFDGVRP